MVLLSYFDFHFAKSYAGLQPLMDSGFSDYSTTVIRARQATDTPIPALSSILTIRPSPDPNATVEPVLPAVEGTHSPSASTDEDPLGTSSIFSIASIDSYHTAHTASIISSALATEGGSTIRSLHGNYTSPLVHRFTLIKPGAKPKKSSISGAFNINGATESAGWNPLDLFFSSGLLIAKCDVCTKRLGWKPVLECDDCGLRFV